MLEHWKKEVDTAPFLPNLLKISQEDTIKEAARTALFLKTYWKPSKKLPGLESNPELSLQTAQEILSLIRAIQEAQLALMLEEEAIPVPPSLAPEVLSKEVLSELHQTFLYLLGRPLPEEEATLLQKTMEIRANPESSLELILLSYIETAKKIKHHLIALGADFEMGTLDEAELLLTALEESGQQKTKQETREKAARTLVYRLFYLLQERVSLIRKAATFIFRKYPDVVRQVTSARGRQQRTNHRSRKKKE